MVAYILDKVSCQRKNTCPELQDSKWSSRRSSISSSTPAAEEQQALRPEEHVLKKICCGYSGWTFDLFE